MEPDQIIDDALQAVEQGASMLHIHARDGNGRPEWRPEPYARIFAGIRKHHPDVVLIATTSGREHGTFEKRAAVLDLDGDARPDMASLTLGSLNFPETASVSAPETIRKLAARMKERHILPELGDGRASGCSGSLPPGTCPPKTSGPASAASPSTTPSPPVRSACCGAACWPTPCAGRMRRPRTWCNLPPRRNGCGCALSGWNCSCGSTPEGNRRKN
jgi:hypothetical protein